MSTFTDVGAPDSLNTYTNFASDFSNATGTVMVYSPFASEKSVSPASF